MTNLSLLGKFAIRYLKDLGWPVIPLWPCNGERCHCGDPTCEVPGKHPWVAWGGHNLNPDLFREEWVTEFWQSHEHAGIGIPTGPTTGICSLDFDKRHKGLETFESLIKANGEFPRTPTFDTGGGGFQMVFQYPGGYVKTRSNIMAGLDIRGAGGLFVAPPSFHKSGRNYKWRPDTSPTKVAIAPLPQWFLDFLTETDHKKESGTYSKDSVNRYFIPDSGARNDFCSSWLGSLRNVYPRDLVEPLVLMLAEHLEQGPAWAYKSLDSMYAKPAIKPPRSQYEKEVLAAGEENERVGLLDIRDAWRADRPKPAYLVDSVLTERDIAAIVAPPEMGKSLISLHLAIAVAGGKPLFGRYNVPTRQRVLYINAENPDEMFLDRIRDVANGMGLNADDLVGWLFVTKENKFDLGSNTPDSVVIEEMLFKHEIKLVVLDSLVSFLKGNPDSAQDVRIWFDTVAREWRRTYKCASVLLHHTNKPDPKFAKKLRNKTDQEVMNSARNSGDIPAGVDRFIAVEKETEHEEAFGPCLDVYFRMAKSRSGDKMPPLLLKIEKPSDFATSFAVAIDFAGASLTFVQSLVKEILATQPIPQMALKDLALVLSTKLQKSDGMARKWLDKLRKRQFLEEYSIGGGHNEIGLRLTGNAVAPVETQETRPFTTKKKTKAKKQ